MIIKQDLDKIHSTYSDTCLMSNYAVCCNYFTGIDINDYFADYISEFDDDFSDPTNFFNNPYLQRILTLKGFSSHYNSSFQNFLIDYNQYKSSNSTIGLIMNNYGSIFTAHYHVSTYNGYIPYNADPGMDIGGFPFVKLLHDNVSQQSFIQSRKLVEVINLTKNEHGIFPKNNLGIVDTKGLMYYIKKNPVIINAFKSQHSYTIYYDLQSHSFWVHDTNSPMIDIPISGNWLSNYGDILLYKLK